MLYMVMAFETTCNCYNVCVVYSMVLTEAKYGIIGLIILVRDDKITNNIDNSGCC